MADTWTSVRAGRLALTLAGPDLRYISFEGEEIVRRVYMAVRDLNWGTIPAVEEERTVEVGEASFSVRMRLSNRTPELGFEWDLEIDGDQDGTIDYVMRARALCDCEFAKIGLNVHHPLVGVSGRRWAGVRSGERIGGEMPKLIDPQIELRASGVHLPMIPPVEELSLDQAAGSVRFSFGGDLYETEDQRNWSDASYKTYSMPAFTGYVHKAAAGEEIVQRVRIEFEPRAEGRQLSGRRSAGPPTGSRGRLELGTGTAGPRMPPLGIGLGNASGLAALEPLRELAPAHLRLDLALSDSGWGKRLEAALADCAAIGADLELVLRAAGDLRSPLSSIERIVGDSGAQVVRIIILPIAEEVTPSAWVELARKCTALETDVGGGSDFDFAQVLRSIPHLRPFPFLAWSLNPQVHAFTDPDLVENLDGQSEQLRSARVLAGERELCVTPVTLRPRIGVGGDATTGAVDPRQTTLFTAAWTIGSVKQMAEGGADSVTYYEAIGGCGVMDDGEVFPAFHALADANELRGARLLPLESGEEPWLSGIVATRAGTLVALVANLDVRERDVEVAFGGDQGPARLRILDSRTERLARSDPAGFRASGELVESRNGTFQLQLEPYAYARLECGLSQASLQFEPSLA